MKAGHLSRYFTGVAVKRLSAVEADIFRSNKHEFNGVEGPKRLFGQSHGKQTYPARFIYLNDHEDDPAIADGYLTWYDASTGCISRPQPFRNALVQAICLLLSGDRTGLFLLLWPKKAKQSPIRCKGCLAY